MSETAQPVDREQLVDELIAANPHAVLRAANEHGTVVPLPPALARYEGRVSTHRSALEFVHGDDIPLLLKAWHDAQAEGSSSTVLRLRVDQNKTTTLHYIDLLDKHGVIACVFLMDPDTLVSGDVAEIMPAPRFSRVVKDGFGVFVDVDEALPQILGRSREEILGQRSLEFIHPDDHDLAIGSWMAMLSSPAALSRQVRLRHLRKDGSIVWLESQNHNLLTDPDNPRVVNDLVDVSEEMAALEAVREREQLLHRLAEALPLGVIQIDADRRVVYANDRLASLVGAPIADSLDTQLHLIAPDDRRAVDAALQAVLVDGEDRDLELRLVVHGAGSRLCLVSLRALSDEGGTPTGAVACVSDVTDAAELRAELRRQATVDPLTGCLNRAAVMTALDQRLERQVRGDGTAVVFLDLDMFKQINDRYGHAAGDELLKVVAARLAGATGAEDTVGRLGGDEFLVVCPGVATEADAAAIAARLETVLHADVRLEVGMVPLAASIGLAWTDAPRVSADDLVARADARMYEAKAIRSASRAVPAPRGCGCDCGHSAGSDLVGQGSSRGAGGR